MGEPGLRAVAILLALAAPARAEGLILVDEATSDCWSKRWQVEWKTTGEIEVLDALRAMSRLLCESYVVPRQVAHTRVTLSVKSEKIAAGELRERLVGALRANGLSLDTASVYRLDKSDARPRGGEPEVPPEEIDKHVRCKDNQCEIDRSFLDQLLANTSALAMSARFVPSVKEGVANGLKLYAIRPTSLFAKLGLQNGDTVTAVDGQELTSPDRMLAVYTRLRGATAATVHVLRRGEPVTLRFTVK